MPRRFPWLSARVLEAALGIAVVAAGLLTWLVIHVTPDRVLFGVVLGLLIWLIGYLVRLVHRTNRGRKWWP